MTPAMLIGRVRAHGGTIRAAGDKLKLSAPRPLPGELMDAIRARKGELLAALELANDPATRSYRWRITQPGGEPYEMVELPEPTLADLQARYPGAAIAPLPEVIPVLELTGELEALLAHVAKRYEWTDEDVALARQACGRDPDGHVVMFRHWLAQPWPMPGSTG